MLPLSLPALRRLAASVAAEESDMLDLIGTMAPEGAADYLEVIFGVRGPSDSFRTFVVTVKRRVTQLELSQTLRRGVRAHFRTA